MDETGENPNDPEVPENLFNNVKFFVSGEVPDKVLDLLKCGGAERLNYFSDYVTHLICGESPEENDISDANELYEIPAVVANWVFMCIKLKKLVNTKPYVYNLQKLFSNLVFCLSKLGNDREILWAIITYHGGVVQLNLDNKCTHLVTIDVRTSKYEKAVNLGPDKIAIVTPDWIIESVKHKSLAQADLFHPKLIQWPKVIKHESTTAITGFEPESVEPLEKPADSITADSTQALLVKLKQRMSSSQPPAQTTSNADVVPPNVIAPSFLSKNQQNQAVRTFNQQTAPPQITQPEQQPVSTTFVQPQSIVPNQQIPRSIVHHTPHPQQLMQQQQQSSQPQQQQQQPVFSLPNQLHLNRLIGQGQARPTLQQLRGQLAPNQLHQQLIQQRLAQQQNQQNAQRPLSIQQQQQLIQQQLAQGQLGPARQLIKNQAQQQQQLQQQQQQLNQLNQQLLGQNQQIGQPQLAQSQAQTQLGHVTLPQNQVQQQLPQQNQQINQLQQQNALSQGQQFGNIVQQQQPQQAQHILQQQQQNQVLQQQQTKIFVSQQQNQQQIIQNQPNLAIQQQFVGTGSQPQPPQQFNQQQQQQPQPQQQQQQQHFVQNQQDLAQQQQQQNIVNQQIVQSPQFQQNNIINQQLLLNQQQNQFNQQQAQQQPPQSPQQQQQQQQPRPQINQHLWQQQQQQQQQQQMTIRHPVNIVQQGPRIQWSPNQQQPNQLHQRQFIQLDAQTHNQLQKMPREQQALFVQRLQKQKQLLMQKQQLQQRAGGGHILIRGSVPTGLSPQQQMQWLQQQAKQQGVVLPPNIQQQTITPGTLTQQNIAAPNIQHAPGLSPIQQQAPQFADQNQQQQQLQLRQYRLQQLQLQREQAQKNQLAVQQQQQQQQQQPQPPPPSQPGVVRPLGPAAVADSTTNPPEVNVSQQLVVNAKTKTALANMLSIRLQSGGGNVGPGVPEAIPEPSAAGTLRLMTAQHNAALNPNNRPQDLIALQQRRVINGPNGEIIRAPIPQAVPVTPQTEPPKLPFSPRATVPLQHRPGPFYGHNPNLKLPPDLFLLGCIFVVVEIERYLDEAIPGWQQKIEKHGGEVEKQYCNRVTHVLCETQRHGVVMQALRDCKRCITIYWLSDVMKRKQVLPPWTALHLPTIYLDTTPASKHLITLSGFSGCERNRVKHMINYTGAKFTSYFSKHNTILIASKGEGSKYAHAKKWGIPVVNVQWLTDIMLGNFAALNQMEHIMYQQFPTPPNFSFDPKLVPNLMHAWKMPINISQESYERVKRSASPVLMPKKMKKIKTENTDENDNVNSEVMETNTNYRILFSMSSDTAALQKIVKQLGGILAKSHQDCTHLVMPVLARSNKLLFCLCRDVHIMPEQWLKDSHSAQKFLDETNYSLDTKDFNSEYKCDFTQTLNTKNRNKLFEGKSFWITPSVFPSKTVLVELVQSCGGVVEKIRRTAAQIEATNINSPYSYIIITHENDIHLVADLLRNKKDKVRIVCSAELIFSAILKQTFEVEPFAVKVI